MYFFKTLASAMLVASVSAGIATTTSIALPTLTTTSTTASTSASTTAVLTTASTSAATTSTLATSTTKVNKCKPSSSSTTSWTSTSTTTVTTTSTTTSALPTITGCTPFNCQAMDNGNCAACGGTQSQCVYVSGTDGSAFCADPSAPGSGGSCQTDANCGLGQKCAVSDCNGYMNQCVSTDTTQCSNPKARRGLRNLPMAFRLPAQ